ncbi:MAG: 6-phosphogluconolactonase [bacterium]
MSIELKTTTKTEDAANFLFSSISNQLNQGKKVLFFVTGGSSISVVIKISELLHMKPHQNLTIMLTDERYGELNHVDSNWYQLIQKGFHLPQATLVPILIGDDRDTTTEKFIAVLAHELSKAEYTIGLFGVGEDGHTCGILPESKAAYSEKLAFAYDAAKFSRITITQKAIEKFDEAVAWIQGKNKWGIVKDLLEKNIEIAKQPAQILKKVPLLTIFTDYHPSSRA